MIKIVPKPSYNMGTNCYGVSDGEKYVIIDPAVNYNEMDQLCDGVIAGILITHGHFDHIEELQSYLDNTDIYIYGHKNALKKLQNSLLNCSCYFGNELLFACEERYICVEESENIKILGENIKVLENFGHTNCSLSYIIGENMFCGDFIFAGSIGRTDLPTASYQQMKESLQVLKECDQDYTLYPGHGPNTTINIEKKRNPYLNV